MAQIADPDASGGMGSFGSDILGILTGAIQTVGIPYVAKELNLQQTTDAAGNVKYAGAPTRPTAAQAVGGALSHPLVLLGGVLLAGLLVWKIVK